MSRFARYIVDANDDIVEIINQEEPDTWWLLNAVSKYENCMVWAELKDGWHFIPSEGPRTPWQQGVPPNTVLMVELIRGQL